MLTEYEGVESAYRNGVSISQIARNNGISRQRVDQLLRRMGVQRRPKKRRAPRTPRMQKSADEFVNIYNSSKTIAEIAERTARTISGVSSYATTLRNQGVDLPRKKAGRPRKIKLAPAFHQAYLAGLIDASGYFSLRLREDGGSTYVACKLAITAPSQAVADQLVERHAGHIRRAGVSIYVEWNGRDGIKALLKLCYGFLRARKAHADCMLRFISTGDVVEVENLRHLYHPGTVNLGEQIR